MDLLYFGNIFYYLILQPFKTLSGSVQVQLVCKSQQQSRFQDRILF